MKAATIITAVAAMMVASSAMGQIAGSPHDFSQPAVTWSGGEICKPCHTPHFADTTVGYLWAHTLSTQTYTLYDGSTSTAGTPELDQNSIMCLSCHDGTVALNDFHNGGGPAVYIPDSANVALPTAGPGDLSDDHPIGNQAHYPILGSGRFNAATANPWDPTTYSVGPLRLRPLGPDHVVSCTSCHTPHNAGHPDLLRASNAASALCLTCHIK